MRVKKHWLLIAILAVALLLRIIFFTKFSEVWWDGAVYLSMGKYLFSLGEVGLWEPIRPLVMPFILGLGWKLGLNPVIWGKVIAVVASMGVVLMTYLVARKYSTGNAALIASSFVAFFPPFFLFSFRIYTEILSVLFALMAVYWFKEDTLWLSGLLAALAALTRFHSGIVLVILGVIALRYGRKVGWYALGAALLAVPYLLYHLVAHGGFHYLVLASKMIGISGLWIFSQPWWYYLWELFRGNFLLVFLVPGILIFLKGKKRTILFIGLLLLVYLSIVAHKEPRFLLVALPWLAIIAAEGLSDLLKWEWVPYAAVAVSFVLLFLQLPVEYDAVNVNNEEYYRFIEGEKIEAEVLSTNPYVGLYASTVVRPIYLDVIGVGKYPWTSYVDDNDVGYVFVDNCEGGLMCAPDDSFCLEKRSGFVSVLDEGYEKVYSKELDNGCWYRVYSR